MDWQVAFAETAWNLAYIVATGLDQFEQPH